ncbi:MAG: murein transglycosylase A [Elusimicrobiales bacterium]|nr:murein transglycosylase A [Elusimicrobiales bacterium]
MKQVTLVILALALAGCSAGLRKQSAAGACPPCPAPGAPAAVSTAAPAAAGAAMFLVAPDSAPVLADGDDLAPLLKAALQNRAYLQSLNGTGPAYDFGARKVYAKDLAETNEELIKILLSSPTAQDLDRLVKERFDVYQLAGRDSTGTVVFSSYYEPTLEASLKKTKKYKYPIYGKPEDLVTINLGDFNEKFKGEKLTGLLKGDQLVPYLTRDEIDFQGKLKKKARPLAWFTNRADIMDLHTEGSGRLALPDGRIVKAKFAATNSHKFKGWLTAMIETGALPREGISHEKGLQYLEEHPEQVRDILSRNRRYVFFSLDEKTDPDEGPDGTYGRPLTGWRSIAIDNTLVPMGALAFMSVQTPDVDAEGVLLGRKQDRRFVFCQDTGGAIKGPGRVDFFAGAGKKARTFAFKLWDPGQLYLLLLKQPAGTN